MIYIITHPKSIVLFPIGQIFYNSLKDNGYKVEHFQLREINDYLYKEGDFVIIIGAGRFPNFNVEQKQENVKYVLWQSEQLPIKCDELEKSEVGKKRLSTLEKLLPYYDYYFDYYPSQISFMEKRGWKVDGCVPLGYHETLDYTDKFDLEIKWDVVFMGTMSERRKKQFESIKKRCNVFPNNSSWGLDFYKILYQTKIGLNIHFEYLDTLEFWRILNYLCNKKLIVSEIIVSPEPLIDGQHFIMARRDEFVDVVDQTVKNYEELKHIAVCGYDFIKNEYKFNDMTKKMIGIIDD